VAVVAARRCYRRWLSSRSGLCFRVRLRLRLRLRMVSDLATKHKTEVFNQLTALVLPPFVNKCIVLERPTLCPASLPEEEEAQTSAPPPPPPPPKAFKPITPIPLINPAVPVSVPPAYEPAEEEVMPFVPADQVA
jgi:hypothetical protein